MFKQIETITLDIPGDFAALCPCGTLRCSYECMPKFYKSVNHKVINGMNIMQLYSDMLMTPTEEALPGTYKVLHITKACVGSSCYNV